MSETDYRNNRGKPNKNGRNNQNSHFNHHKQHFVNEPMKSNDIDELLSQRPSFTQLTINETPMRSHFGLGYHSHPSTTATTATTRSLFRTRFVPASASQNLPATDPSLLQQNGTESSLHPQSSRNILESSTTESDINITTNNQTEEPRSSETNTKQGNTPKVDDNTAQANNSLPCGETNNIVLSANDQNITEYDEIENWSDQPIEDNNQQRPQQYGMANDNDVGSYTDYGYDDPGFQQQSDVDEDVFDFGLCDSDDDEYIQGYLTYQQQQQQQHNYQTMMMSHYHSDMYGQMQYNNQHYMSNGYQQNRKHRWYEDSPSGQLRRIDRRVQLFLSDPSRETYQLPGMSTYCRRQVQGLATLYKLKMSHEDVGNNKIGPLLKKGPRTQIPADRRVIEKHINKIRTVEKAKKQMERRPGGAASEVLNRTKKEERRRLKGLPASDLTPKTPKSEKKSNPRTVGADSAPLASNNIGHRMMSNMGWKEGDSLGVNNDGISNPIQPVIRKNRRGLGA